MSEASMCAENVSRATYIYHNLHDRHTNIIARPQVRALTSSIGIPRDDLRWRNAIKWRDCLTRVA
jgi:hypothetical protein